jgi:hypothetical protein
MRVKDCTNRFPSSACLACRRSPHISRISVMHCLLTRLRRIAGNSDQTIIPRPGRAQVRKSQNKEMGPVGLHEPPELFSEQPLAQPQRKPVWSRTADLQLPKHPFTGVYPGTQDQRCPEVYDRLQSRSVKTAKRQRHRRNTDVTPTRCRQPKSLVSMSFNGLPTEIRVLGSTPLRMRGDLVLWPSR